MNVEIPGFYYDPEKKKYFKIQANHVAPPGAQYSKESVKRKRNEHQASLAGFQPRSPMAKYAVLAANILQEQEKRAKVNQRLERETVRKPSLLHHPLMAVERELGSRWSSTAVMKERQARVYVSQLKRRKLHKFEPWPSPFNIRHVLRNPRSGALITTTLDSGPDGDSFLAPRLLPNPDEGGDYRWPSEFHHPLKIHLPQTLWCSAACPVGDKALFAIGTSDGLHTLEGLTSMWTVSQKPFRKDDSNGARGFRRHGNSSHASVQAVEWISPDVVVSGLRNSNVFLYDVRNGESSLRLQHSQSVTKIRKADPWRIVVGGHNTVCDGYLFKLRTSSHPAHAPSMQVEMYDLRYVAKCLHSKPKPMSGSHNSTRPYLSFKDFTPEEIPDLDVSSELGLLACGKIYTLPFSLLHNTSLVQYVSNARCDNSLA
ncbi:hypothetical protein N7539_002136 [Penicillium diatomitis]|uniref:Uncharacterized protein n=1 Tax=Penicillium diatomitis TaxID=2819901 RepID=A0A9X0C0R4_9EURO|nr:uncharacterized protein N7539_002136 [Penicillium diatomitis]KAJ5493390.1 hypothetical protein N7539_002136 [Penicillium diatomitis]